MEIGKARPPYIARVDGEADPHLFVAWHHLTDWQQGVAARATERTEHEGCAPAAHYAFEGMRLRFVVIHGQIMEVTPLLPQIPALAGN